MRWIRIGALALVMPVIPFAGLATPAFGETPEERCTFIASTEVKRKNGLGAQVLFVNKNQESKELVVNVMLENHGKQDLYLALIPPAPQALDNQGASYTYDTDHRRLVIGRCEYINGSRDQCLENNQDALQPGEFTKLETASTVLFQLVFQNLIRGNWENISETGILTLSFNLAVSEGAPPVDEDPVDVNRGLETVNISFPLIPLDPDFDRQNDICVTHE